MAETKMLSAEEINKLKDLNNTFGKTVSSIGDIEIKLRLLEQKAAELNQEKELLLKDYDKLREKETELSEQLLQKYGEGKIDIESGKIELL